MPTLFSTGWQKPSGNYAGARGEANLLTWNTPQNIKFKDSTYASATISPASGYSQYLYADDFHFSIPSSAVIQGISFGINKFVNTAVSEIFDDKVRLLITGTGTLFGNNLASGLISWPHTTITGIGYGSSGNLWGLTWNPSDVEQSGFGVVLQAKSPSSFINTFNVDNISGNVYYSFPEPTSITQGLPLFLSCNIVEQGLPLFLGRPVHCTDWLSPQRGFSHYFGDLGPQAHWSNPNNITGNDSSYANIVTSNQIAFTNILSGDDFDFNIPDSATIIGFELGLKRHALSGSNTIGDWDMYILAPGTGNAELAFHYGFNTQLWPTGQENIYYGSHEDLWGVDLTPSIVNASGFGFGLQAYRNFSFDEARVIHASGQICYIMPDSIDSGIPLFTQGSQQTGINNNLPLFLWGNDGFPLFTAGHLSTSGNTPLYIGGHITLSGGIPLYIGAAAPFGQIPLYTHGANFSSGAFPLYLKALDVSNTGGSGDIPLFVQGKSGVFETLSSNLPLFLENEGYDGSIPLYLSVDSIGRPTFAIPLYMDAQSYEGGTAYIPLFIATQSGFNSDVPLFIEGLRFGDNAEPGDGWYQATGGMPLYISRQLLFDSNLPLFLAQNQGSGDNFIPFYIQGTTGSNSSGLPLVMSSVINSSKLVPLYTSGF